MNNHVHLLIKENQTELSKFIKKIGSSYVYYFNLKYGRSGHLFQDRFKSEAVESDAYFHTVIRYIHNNPVKAGIGTLEGYKWSSYRSYINEFGIVDTRFYLELLAAEKDEAVKRYIRFMNQPTNDNCLEMKAFVKLSDEKARSLIKEIGNLESISDIQKLEIKQRDSILRRAREIDGISVLQISRITGLSRGKIASIQQ